MADRTDVHRPSAINPADYEYVAQEHMKIECFGDCEIVKANRELIRAHMARTGGDYSRHVHGGNCAICGSVNAVYTVLFYHRPTNTYVRTGQDCAEKLDGSFDGSAFRTATKHYTELQAGKRKAEGALAEMGLEAAWKVYVADYSGQASVPYEESTIMDIVGKLVRYGSISEGQIKFLGGLVERIARRAEIAAQRAAEQAAAAPVPVTDARISITGRVLTIREEQHPHYYGRTTFKVLVKAEAGWKVWGTLSTSMSGAKVGDTVAFDAVVKVSDRDPKFGFFSRPTKGRVIEQVAQAHVLS